MAKYELKELVDIRVMREDKTSQALVKAQQAVREAAEKVKIQEQKLQAFREEKPGRQDRLYAAVLKQVVGMQRIEKLKEALSALDEEELLYERELHHAQELLETRKNECEQAHTDYLKASKNVMKLNSHHDIWEEEEKRNQELLQDLEMEEFTPPKKISEDSDDPY